MFENLQRDATIADETDRLGGSGPMDTDVYSFVIETAYFDKSKGGAMSLNLQLKTAQGGNLKQIIYVTSGNQKGNRNYYMVKKNGQETGEKAYLPGFLTGNAIALLAVGKELAELQVEEKVLNIYDFTQKKDVPTKKDVIMELNGAEIDLGVYKQTVDKKINSANPGDPAVYVVEYKDGVPQTRTENEIDKVFRTRDGLTVAEVTAGTTEAIFRDKWANLNKGKVKDKTTVKADDATPGLPTGSPTSAAGASSLFK